jgi:hypothetical protein
MAERVRSREGKDPSPTLISAGTTARSGIPTASPIRGPAPVKGERSESRSDPKGP